MGSTMIKKSSLAIMAVLITFLSLSSFTPIPDKDNAKVEPYEGISIYYLSKPAGKYDYIGSFKTKISWSGGPKELLNLAIKKVKKDFPKANAIIFKSSLMDEGDAVTVQE